MSKALKTRRDGTARQLVSVKAEAVARKVMREGHTGDGAALSESGEP